VKRTCMGLATALAYAVFGTVTALAQPASPAVAPKVEIGSDTKYVAVVLAGDIQEEVEILRRLLANGLADAYGFPSHKTLTPYRGVRYYPLIGPAQITESSMGDNSTNGMAGSFVPADQPAPHPEGVYLKDYGVVYTATLPPPPSNPLPGTTVGVVHRIPLSAWDRARKELRGETVEPDGTSVNEPPPLADVILKVLADNGKHFTRLAEGERITVAVTFRDDAANGILHPQLIYTPMLGAPAGMPPGGSFPGGTGVPGVTGGSPYIASGGHTPPPSGSPRPAGAPEDDAAWLTEVRNRMTLSDLHVKQQNYPAAIIAYKNTQELLQKAFDAKRELSPEDAASVLTTAQLFLHLAKGYESAGDNEASRKAMQKVGSLSKMAATLAGALPAAKAQPAAPPALPSKLVVTASKKLLDEVGAGKMTFEAFRKAATVEYVTPSAADKK